MRLRVGAPLFTGYVSIRLVGHAGLPRPRIAISLLLPDRFWIPAPRPAPGPPPPVPILSASSSRARLLELERPPAPAPLTICPTGSSHPSGSPGTPESIRLVGMLAYRAAWIPAPRGRLRAAGAVPHPVRPEKEAGQRRAVVRGAQRRSPPPSTTWWCSKTASRPSPAPSAMVPGPGDPALLGPGRGRCQGTPDGRPQPRKHAPVRRCRGCPAHRPRCSPPPRFAQPISKAQFVAHPIWGMPPDWGACDHRLRARVTCFVSSSKPALDDVVLQQWIGIEGLRGRPN